MADSGTLVFRGSDGLETIFDSPDELMAFLAQVPADLWQSNAGDAGITMADSTTLILFALSNEQWAILNPDDYTLPQPYPERLGSVEHYVGGEPMYFPKSCLCSRSEMLTIIRHAVVHRNPLPDYRWVELEV